jgi:NADPH:quinone reductase-like Zn-dependent oxidoreductase
MVAATWVRTELRLAGKVAIIIGAAGGIGEAAVRLFAILPAPDRSISGGGDWRAITGGVPPVRRCP